MAFPRSTPITFRPSGLSDAVDATNAPAGAMGQLVNLIPDPSTDGVWICRPASLRLTNFEDFTAPNAIAALLVVGDLAYGMVSSSRNPGKDEPFVYNRATNAFVAVAGIAEANTPTSQSTQGDWAPPIAAQVGSRIIVTHPGFPGGLVKFGWFDVSGFDATVAGNVNGSAISGNPSVLGVQPGMVIEGAGIPLGATVIATSDVAVSTMGDTHTNTTLDNLASVAGVAIGQAVSGVGIPAGTTVANLVGNVVTLSQAATTNGTGVEISFAGSTITISPPATAAANNVLLTITGGTKAAPLWGAGDTDRNPLPSVPVGIAQMNGRAWYAVGLDGIVFSDPGFACRVSNATAVQALTTNDGLAVTAIGPLMLGAPITGGIVQSLIAFQGASKMQQIIGDPTTGNLKMDAMPVATGTLAPLTIAPCDIGTAFVSPQGLCYVDFNGRVSPPIGDAGRGVVLPFIFSLYPGRMCAAANADTIRISTIVGNVEGQPAQEFWYRISRQSWSGPHSFPALAIQPWRNTFLLASPLTFNSLWQSDAYVGVQSTFVENGTQMRWAWQPSPLPDSGQMAENSLVEMTLAMAVPAGVTVTLTAQDIDRGAGPISGAQWNAFNWNGAVWGGLVASQLIDTTTITYTGMPAVWDGFAWGQAVWDGAGSPFQQFAIDWHVPLVFKQLILTASGDSGYNLKIGNLYMRYQILGYKLQAAS